MDKFLGGLFEDLTLYAAQEAWWGAVPKRPAPKGTTTTQPQESRAEIRQKKGLDLFMPPVHAAATYLIEHWHELGRVGSGGFGPVRLSYQEIAAWSELAAVDVEPWEVHALRLMSGAFVGESQKAEAEAHPAPWQPAPETIDRTEVAKRIRSVLRD